MATLWNGTADEGAAQGLKVVMVSAETKQDAQSAIKLAKTWIWANGLRCKVVFFHEIIGTEWSNLGRSYRARIAYKA
jgi:hypothetical protein